MSKYVTIHYDGKYEREATVKCDCGCSFEFQSQPRGFCPRCGGQIKRYVADNIPMEKVPNGYKAYLFNMYDTYRNEYYYDSDHSSDRLEYLCHIYNNGRITYRGNGKKLFMGYCYEKGYKPLFYEPTYMGYENTNGTFKKITTEQFKEILQKEIEKANTEKEKRIKGNLDSI